MNSGHNADDELKFCEIMVDECHHCCLLLNYYWTKCSKRTATQWFTKKVLYKVYTDFTSDIQNFGCIEYFCCWNTAAMRYAMQEYSPI